MDYRIWTIGQDHDQDRGGDEGWGGEAGKYYLWVIVSIMGARVTFQFLNLKLS